MEDESVNASWSTGCTSSLQVPEDYKRMPKLSVNVFLLDKIYIFSPNPFFKTVAACLTKINLIAGNFLKIKQLLQENLLIRMTQPCLVQ